MQKWRTLSSSSSFFPSFTPSSNQPSNFLRLVSKAPRHHAPHHTYTLTHSLTYSVVLSIQKAVSDGNNMLTLGLYIIKECAMEIVIVVDHCGRLTRDWKYRTIRQLSAIYSEQNLKPTFSIILCGIFQCLVSFNVCKYRYGWYTWYIISVPWVVRSIITSGNSGSSNRSTWF